MVYCLSRYLLSSFLLSGYGGLGLSIEGPSKVDINCEDVEDGTCKVTYCPTEPGNYIINIKFADQHVPGTSSWSMVGSDPITTLSLFTDLFYIISSLFNINDSEM